MIEQLKRHFIEGLEALRDSMPVNRDEKAQKLSSQADRLSESESGVEFLFENIADVAEAGYFENTSWGNPGKLVPSLVRGTLQAGHPSSTMEVMSDLRMLAISLGNYQPEGVTREEAKAYLEEVIIHNLDFAFNEPVEQVRLNMSPAEIRKVCNLFQFLLNHIELEGIKEKLADEIRLICEQRPVVVLPVLEMISLANNRLTLRNDLEGDKLLKFYVDAVYNPSPLAIECKDSEVYAKALRKASAEDLQKEAESFGKYLNETGLSNEYVAVFLRYMTEANPNLIPVAMGLSDTGKAEWEEHSELVTEIIKEIIEEFHNQPVYGLACMLDRNLFSREAVRAGIDNLRRIALAPQVESRIIKSIIHHRRGISARQYLVGATIRILGQPLGIGQGNNATCQSARGICMWSLHAPAKLLNYIITAATQDNLSMRFENEDLESRLLAKGLIDKLDYNLDAVSIVLVPHLDKIYNEMMRRAMGRGEDPHKWVNPALYGQWIQVGFTSVYNALTNSINDFRGFIRCFYAGFHPKYNDDQRMVYPNPVGIFITSSRGEMLGFHAVSLFRVDYDPNNECRAYFVNPNNEGRQDWGQGIKPTVYGHGENHGESSLPFHEFAARLYAFHYNSLEVENNLDNVPEDEIIRVEKLAKASWGKAYIWMGVLT